jgi:hypothetical protein
MFCIFNAMSKRCPEDDPVWLKHVGPIIIVYNCRNWIVIAYII